MLTQEKGTVSGSEEFHPKPSKTAKKLLYHVTDCGVYFCNFGYRVEREDYGNYMMLFVTKGVLAVSTEGVTYLVKEGEGAFFNCHVHHTYYAKGTMSFYWIHFDGVNTHGLYQEYVRRNHGIVLKGKQAGRLRKNILQIVSCYRNQIPADETEHALVLYDCLMTFLGADDGGGKAGIIEQAKDYIQKNMGGPLTLDTVAGYVGLSPSHFSRQFKKETGYSPYDYIILVRINKAKHLLLTTDMTVKEIACRTGYNSESGFCNSFIRRVGLSPVNFKNL